MEPVSPEPLVRLDGVAKHFGGGRGLFRRSAPIHAVDGVSFSIAAGERIGLLGESGCGKTTTGRMLVKLTEPSRGGIYFAGRPIAGLAGAGLKAFREKVQLVFQNPFDAFNPRFTIGRSLAEPLVNAGTPKTEWRGRIERALRLARFQAGLGMLDRYPHQLSGGQLQRVVIARALVLSPTFLVADEPVSMLDVSIRAGILNLLRSISEELALTSLVISHDLSLVRYLCRRTLVMYLGTVVEDGPTDAIIREPLHPYTKALVAAVPTPDPDQSRAPLPIGSTPPDARSQSTVGCRFAPRCPAVMARCRTETPLLRSAAPDREVACHLFA